MTTEQQNLAWKCLPKEVREEIKSIFNMPSKYGYLDSTRRLLIDVYGYNLTSDEDPSELLFVERKKVQEYFATEVEINHEAQDSKNDMLYQRSYAEICLLKFLFGDKCLPDKEPSVQGEKMFNKGDLVKCLTDGQIYEVEKKHGLYHYCLKGKDNIVHINWLEPYTEPETKSIKVGDKVRVKGDTKVREVYRVLPDGKVMFGDKGSTHLAINLELIEPETKDNMEEKELNLVELLKGCEKEKFYSPMLSDVFIVQLRETSIHIVPCDEGHSERFLFVDKYGVWTKGGQCVLFPSRTLYEKYPLDPYAAWMEWKSERTPKRWRAKEGGIYWLIPTDGSPIVSNTEHFTKYQNRLYEFGNYFRTKEEAQQAAEAVRRTLIEFHAKHNEQ